MSAALVIMSAIRKQFGAVTANADVDLEIRSGEGGAEAKLLGRDLCCSKA